MAALFTSLLTNSSEFEKFTFLDKNLSTYCVHHTTGNALVVVSEASSNKAAMINGIIKSGDSIFPTNMLTRLTHHL